MTNDSDFEAIRYYHKKLKIKSGEEFFGYLVISPVVPIFSPQFTEGSSIRNGPAHELR